MAIREAGPQRFAPHDPVDAPELDPRGAVVCGFCQLPTGHAIHNQPPRPRREAPPLRSFYEVDPDTQDGGL